ncbi:MAG: hypothetical protein O7H41_15900 [Planctomycetota bacterium]|nr:hypothetical protein [Planctomycetota bacterium]
MSRWKPEYEDRIRRIFEHTLCDSKGGRVTNSGRDHDWTGVFPVFRPSWALAHDSPDTDREAALAIFEDPHEDLDVLAQREFLTSHLTDYRTPFYTLDELEALTESLIVHTQHNSEHLLRTGYPQTLFIRSFWLGELLSNLYYTKLPAAIDVIQLPEREEHEIPKGFLISGLASHDPEVRYTWGKSHGRAPFGPGISTILWGRLLMPRSAPEDYPKCSHEEAPYLKGMTPEIGRRLEEGREQIHALKIEILHCILEALRRRDHSQLWTRSLDVLKSALSKEEIEFYMAADRFYSGYDARLPRRPEGWDRPVPGGLSCIVQAVGFCEEELLIGGMHTAKMGMNALPDDARITNYYDSAGKEWRAAWDSVLDRFWEDMGERGRFFRQLGKRVSLSLETDFRPQAEFPQEVVLRMAFPRTVAADAERQLRCVTEQMRDFAEVHGTLPQIEVPSAPISPSSPATAPAVGDSEAAAHSFRREDDLWIIRADGRDLRPVRDIKGMTYIECLLGNPHEQIPCALLVGIVREFLGQRGSEVYRELSEEDRAEMIMCMIGKDKGSPVLDRRATRDALRELRDLEDILDCGPPASQQQDGYVMKKRIIIEQLAAAWGKGKARKLGGLLERHRKSVGNRIEAAFKAIGKADPATNRKDEVTLERHLRSSIIRGVSCLYSPRPQRTWATD